MDSNNSIGFGGKTLHVGINPWTPHFILHKREDGKEEYTGFCMDILNILAQSLNFSYRLVRPEDGEWGDVPDGQWTGLIGLLQNQKVNMSFLLAPSVERSTVAEWTVPVEYWYNNVAVRSDSGNENLWAAFLQPFQWTVYICILGVFLLSLCFMTCVVRCGKRRMTSPGLRHTWSASDIGEFLLGSLLSKGMPRAWTGDAGRAFIAGWCLLALMLTACYTSKLTSLLLSVSPKPPFTSVREMVKRSDYRWGTIGGTKVLEILRISNDSLEQELYSKMMAFAKEDPQILSRDLSVHLSMVLSEKYAFIGESVSLERWASDNCDISILPEKLTGLEYYSIFLPKGSSLRKGINNILLRLQDSGSLSYLRNRWFPSASSAARDRCHDNRSRQQAIRLTTLQGPFYLAAGGLLLSAGVLVLERNVHVSKLMTRLWVLLDSAGKMVSNFQRPN